MSMRDTDLHVTRISPVRKSSSRLQSCYSDSHLQLGCSSHRRNIIHIFAQIHNKVPVEASVSADEISKAQIRCGNHVSGTGSLGARCSVLLSRHQEVDTYHSFLVTFETLKRLCLRICMLSRTPPSFAYFWSSLSLTILGNFWTNLTCTRHHFGFSRSDFSSK